MLRCFLLRFWYCIEKSCEYLSCVDLSGNQENNLKLFMIKLIIQFKNLHIIIIGPKILGDFCENIVNGVFLNIHEEVLYYFHEFHLQKNRLKHRRSR